MCALGGIHDSGSRRGKDGSQLLQIETMRSDHEPVFQDIWKSLLDTRSS